MTNRVYDVIIVGGGPAGATAGLYLSQHGRDVVIIDQKKFPRFKPCGGGLTPRILTRFPQLKNAIERLVLNQVNTIHFYAPDLSCVHYTYREPITLMIRRSEFDAMLLAQCQYAGATVVTSTQVNNIAITFTGVEVRTIHGEQFRSKALIGADGANSFIAQQSGLREKWRSDQIGISLVAEVPQTMLAFQDHSTIHILFGLSGLGYGWVFPKRDYVNLGIAGLRPNHQAGNLKMAYEKFIDTLKIQGTLPWSLETPNIRGGIIPLKGVIPKTQTDRILLCGDAAGFVNGLTGEGIYYAMVSGDLAAKTLITAFQQNDLSETMLSQYQMAWQAEIGDEIMQSVHIQRRLRTHPHLANILVSTVEQHEGMKKMFTDYFMGKMTYNALKRSLMLHFLPQYLKMRFMNLFQTH
jgi:geranylgeranyl reductase family protein